MKIFNKTASVIAFFSVLLTSYAYAGQIVWNAYQGSLFSGSFKHGYTIDLPPGTSGMTPQLSISYNSFLAPNKSGWVGAGWDIPQSFIQTNIDGTFSLFLNSTKHDLVYVASDSPNGCYHTKIETYLKIEKKTVDSDGKKEYWTVFDTNGTEYRFGFNPDSENMLNTSDPLITPYVWRWHLDRIKDTNGNCIYFTYSENPWPNDLGAVYLSRIEYNTEKKRMVEFILEESDRPDMTVTIDEGSEVQVSRRLSEIRVWVDIGQIVNNWPWQLAKKIVFQYDTLNASLLSSITKYGSDGTTALPPESFEYTSFNDGEKVTDLLTGITGVLGDITAIDYSPSSSAPNTSFPENYWLVTSITQDNGMTGAHVLSAASTFDYENGAYDPDSLEFRGFGKVIETRPDYSKVVHIFHQDDALKGREQSIAVTDNLYAPYKSAINFWTGTLHEGVYTVRLEKTEEYTYDGVPVSPRITRSEYGCFDEYGNAGLIIDYGDIAVAGDETYTYREFVYNPDLWIMNRVKHSYITAIENGPKLRESWFYYDRAFTLDAPPFAGSLTREEHWNNAGANSVMAYKYDSYGNLIRKTDPLNHSTEIFYDGTYHTFPELVINAKNHPTTTTFNPVLGKPVSVTDPNGNTTTYAYDVFNRLIRIVKPDDSEAFPTTEIQYLVNASPPHAVIVKNRETEATSGTQDALQVIDGLGKVIQTKSEYDSANMTASDTYYDMMGRTARQSNPYLTDGAMAYSTPDTGIPATRTEFDILGRPTRVTNPDNTFSTITYSNWTASETDENGKTKTRAYDANNQLTEVIENNGGSAYTTRYQYNSLGELLAITDHQGNTSTHEYDSLGRNIKTIDVDLGQRLFSYDPAGNLISETDARGIEIKYQYDALNRQTLIDYPTDKDIQFVYDLNNKRTLSIVYNTLGTDIYSYDKRQRVIEEKRTMDNQIWVTKWEYDSMDRVIRETYPDGEIVQYRYNAQNNLSEIQRGAQIILNNTAYNPAGMMIQKSYGNGWNTAYTYDPQNLRLTGIAATKGLETLQDLTYTYDLAGNMKTLQDGKAGRTETFVYDDLYRMVSAQDDLTTGGFNRSYTYDAIGNLISETDNKTQPPAVTQYTYGQGSAKPHAVTGKTDKMPNVGSFVIDNGKAFCTRQIVRLNNISMGVTQGNPADFYMASENPDFAGAFWQPFSTAPFFTLSPDFGHKVIYFKVKNGNGESKVESDDIEYRLDTDEDSIPDAEDTDNDNDGIPDTADAEPLNPGNALLDPDNDGLSNFQEYFYQTNPGVKDSDGDSWSDFDEIFVHMTSPKSADTDQDGITDNTDPNPNNPYNDGFSEQYSIKRWTFNAGGGRRNSVDYKVADVIGSGFSKSPFADKDGDGMPDRWETDPEHELDPADHSDATGDKDSDGLTNLQEYLYGTHPNDEDSDGDGWNDYQEIFIYHSNPNAVDSDNDGIHDPQDPEPNKQTYIYGISQNYTIRNGNFNAGGGQRASETHAMATDRIDWISHSNATYYSKFSITPGAVNFERTLTNETKTAVLSISNEGIENLIIGDTSLAGSDQAEFSMSQDTCSGLVLSPGVGCTIEVAFEPKSPGAKGTILEIQYDDGEAKHAAIAISGVAISDTTDNCPDVPNPDQKNTDKENETLPGHPPGDELGDACDEDDDNDGLPDVYEINSTGTNPLLVDTNGNGIPDNLEDSDFDGLSNEVEFAQGTDPNGPDIRLSAGLNLFGYPVEVPAGYTSYDLLLDLGTADEVDRIQRYNPETGAFEATTYQGGVASGNEFNIVSGEGYFVYMKTAKAISFSGQITSPEISIKPGFNIVSIPFIPTGYTSYDLITLLGASDVVTGIQRFNRVNGAFETTSYFNEQPAGVKFIIVNSEAYLVFSKSAFSIPAFQ